MFNNYISETMVACEGLIARYVDAHPEIRSLPYGASALDRLRAPRRVCAHHTIHSPELIAIVVGELRGGRMISAVASEHHLSPDTVRKWARQHEINYKRLRVHSITAQEHTKILRLLWTGFIPKQVGDKMHLDSSTISRLAKKAGFAFSRGRTARCIKWPDTHSIAA